MARDKVFQMRLTEGEFSLFSAIAQSHGMSLASWFRGLALQRGWDERWSPPIEPIDITHPETDSDFRKRIIDSLSSPFSETHQVHTATGSELDGIALMLRLPPRFQKGAK